MKSYMIPEDLFLELVKYHLLDLQEPERAERIRPPAGSAGAGAGGADPKRT